MLSDKQLNKYYTNIFHGSMTTIAGSRSKIYYFYENYFVQFSSILYLNLLHAVGINLISGVQANKIPLSSSKNGNGNLRHRKGKNTKKIVNYLSIEHDSPDVVVQCIVILGKKF